MLKKGIYENIINQEVERDIQEAESQQLVCLREQIDEAESPKILADYLAKAIRQKLEDTEDMHDRMTLVNRILAEYGLVEEVQIADTSNLLMEVMTQQKNLLQKHSHSETVRPQSGFRVSNLFTGRRDLFYCFFSEALRCALAVGRLEEVLSTRRHPLAHHYHNLLRGDRDQGRAATCRTTSYGNSYFLSNRHRTPPCQGLHLCT